MTTTATTWEIILAAILAAGGFSFLEWRRTDRRRLAARMAATLVAVAALALLGLRPAWQHASPTVTGLRASLWTPLTAPAAPVPSPDAPLRFTLPDAARFAPAATVIPDAAFLRRHYPTLGILHVFGDGLDPSELAALQGLRVEFTPAQEITTPGLGFLRCPRELTLGDGLTIQGQVGGVPPGTTATLTLEAPGRRAHPRHDGPRRRDRNRPLRNPRRAARCHRPFRLAPAHPRFSRPIRPADLPLGIVVRPPDLPRLLVLEGAPALRHRRVAPLVRVGGRHAGRAHARRAGTLPRGFFGAVISPAIVHRARCSPACRVRTCCSPTPVRSWR